MKGIYKITNKTTGKVYIGESKNIIRRWSEHIEDLTNNKHHSYKLQKDFNKYGIEDLTFEILEIVDFDKYYKYKSLEKENEYIIKYNSIEKGYNIEKSLDVFKEEKSLLKANYINKINEKYKNKEISIENNLRTCAILVEELISEGYNLDFSKTAIYNRLCSKNIFEKRGGSFYVFNDFLEKGYFVNGKESTNKYNNKFYQILVTDLGKDFVIKTLSLKKQE